LSSVIFFPIGVLGNMVLDKIPGINKLNADPEQIQKRFGVFGEPMMLGVILGAGIGLLAEYDLKGVLNLAMSLGAVMLIMPRMVKLLMEGLLPLSDAVRSFCVSVIQTVTIFILVSTLRSPWVTHPYCRPLCY
jgi:PTS system galactitol-specific IIC component